MNESAWMDVNIYFSMHLCGWLTYLSSWNSFFDSFKNVRIISLLEKKFLRTFSSFFVFLVDAGDGDNFINVSTCDYHDTLICEVANVNEQSAASPRK